MLRKITVLIAWTERKKMNNYKEEQIGQSRFSIARYNFFLYIKYELSILYSCGDMFDENCREKEKCLNIEKNQQEKAGSQSHDATIHCQFTYKTFIFYIKQLLRNLLRKITVLVAWRERKENKYKEEKIGQNQFSILRYNLLLLFCIPNMNFPPYTIVQISLTKTVEKKQKWINIGKNKQ